MLFRPGQERFAGIVAPKTRSVRARRNTAVSGNGQARPAQSPRTRAGNFRACLSGLWLICEEQLAAAFCNFMEVRHIYNPCEAAQLLGVRKDVGAFGFGPQVRKLRNAEEYGRTPGSIRAIFQIVDPAVQK